MRSILQDETLRDMHYTFYYGQAPAKPQGRDVAAQVASLKHPGVTNSSPGISSNRVHTICQFENLSLLYWGSRKYWST